MKLGRIAFALSLVLLLSACAGRTVKSVTPIGDARVLSVPKPYRAVPGLSAQQKERHFRQHKVNVSVHGPIVGSTPCPWDELPAYMAASGAQAEAAQLRKAMDFARILGVDFESSPYQCAGCGIVAEASTGLSALSLPRLAARNEVSGALMDFNKRLAKALGQGPAAAESLGLGLPPPLPRAFSDGLYRGESWESALRPYLVHYRQPGGWTVGEHGVTMKSLEEFLNAQGTLKAPLEAIKVSWYEKAGGAVMALGMISLGIGISGAIANYGNPTPDWVQSSMGAGLVMIAVGAPFALLPMLLRDPAKDPILAAVLEHNLTVRSRFAKR